MKDHPYNDGDDDDDDDDDYDDVPAGSPSRGRDVAVYVLDINPLLFILFLCLFLYLQPLQLYFIP